MVGVVATRCECMYMYVPAAPYESRWLPDAGTREDEGGRGRRREEGVGTGDFPELVVCMFWQTD